jgi:hypothetical protein
MRDWLTSGAHVPVIGIDQQCRRDKLIHLDFKINYQIKE